MGEQTGVANVFYKRLSVACHALANMGVQKHQLGVWLDVRAPREWMGHSKFVSQGILWDGMSLEDVYREYGVPHIVAAGIVSRELKRWGI